MGLEIERKFLVSDPSVLDGLTGNKIIQGYFITREDLTVRIRQAENKGFITIKGKTKTDYSRYEFEYEIPVNDASDLLTLFPVEGKIEKIRYAIFESGLSWVVDRFLGENDGLFLAEIELAQPDQGITIPSWVGAEVSDDERYTNASLSLHPYNRWEQNR
ncbi:MAG: CYTH domain-containing protein [Bacteroidetes bacterium]|nr:CYTH domain-containing protein [Bacteroidota bacterium]